MITVIEDTSTETLTKRIEAGVEFCNATWQRLRNLPEGKPAEYQRLWNLLETGSERLRNLIFVAGVYDINICPFGRCKFSDSFVCFGCPERDQAE